jgi:hypothetical protein
MRDPAFRKSFDHPPIKVRKTSMSQLSTPECSSAYRLAIVDLPIPGGPLR